MEKEHYLSFFAIIVVISFVVIFFREPAKSERIINDIGEKSQVETEVKNDQERHNEIDLIDYINLQEENKELKKRIETLENKLFDSYFKINKKMLDLNHFNELLPYPESSEILYKEVEEDKYLLFYTDETGYQLIVSSLEDRLTEQFVFFQLDPSEDFNWFGGNSTYNGFIGDNNIKSVRVIQNETIYDAKIIKVNENIRLWYSIIDSEWKSISEEPDKMRIEALNDEGEVIWRESFKGNLMY